MEQYIEIKRDYSDVLLFFRMGDFYELFFDDAYLASEILNITLTKRGKLEGTSGEERERKRYVLRSSLSRWCT